MRILLFNWRDPKNPDAGGAEQFTHQILKRVVAKGHEVDQFCASFDGAADTEIVDGVRFIRAGGKYSVYQAAKKYYRCTKERYDVVIDEINTIPFQTPRFVDRGERLYALIHQLAKEFWYYELPCPISYVGDKVMEEHWLKRYADVPTITVSASTKKDLDALGFKKVTVIHEGYDYEPLAQVAEKEARPTVVFVGRFKAAKLPDQALEAYRLAKERMPELRLVMVGEGYLRPKLERKGVPDVTFTGRLGLKEKNDIISRSHLLIVPAVREGWGLVVTESNAMGTPALGYNVNGLRDSISDGRTGWLCGNDPKDMAEKIVQVFSDRAVLAQMSARALEDSRQYSWDRSAKELLDIIEK